MQSAFLFAIPWSLGGCMDNDSRKKFDTFYRDIMAGKLEESPVPKELSKLELPFPAENTTYDYYFEVSRAPAPSAVQLVLLAGFVWG